MKEERVTFTGSTGHDLSGRLRRPTGQPRGWAVLAHCFTCGKDLRAARKITDALAEAGFGVLRFDFTGLGDSEGAFEETSFFSNVQDLVSAAQWLEETEAAPALMVGHSLGGTAVIAAAARLATVQAVATIGSPYSPSHAAWILDPVREQVEAAGKATITLAGRELCVGKELLDDLDRTSIERDLQGLRRPLLVLHSPQDTVVGIDNARDMYLAARHPKSFVSLDGADHLLSHPADAVWAGHMIAAWAGRVIPEVDEPTTRAKRGVVEVVTGAGFRSEVRAGPHRWVADEPVRVGGEDAGPTPYDQLLAALGSCTGMTLRMYADRKELPLREVTVTLRHERVHRDDCEACEGESGRVDVIHRVIELQGELDDAQRARLLEIADRCPVHRTLEGPLEIQTSLK